MPNPQLSVLVVDDTKFSSAVIGHVLSQAGYTDIRFASSAMAALAMHEERAARVMVADWLMPEMDGLQLTTRIRQRDEQTNQYTYVMLLTAREGDKALNEAFDRGVDDFISKSAMSEQLLPRIYAADRITQLINRLLEENQLLGNNNALLEQHNMVDSRTALGNRRYFLQRLDDAMQRVETRGGFCTLLVMGLQNYNDLGDRFGEAVQHELLKGTARRLQQLVRPMDVIARIGSDTFAICAVEDNSDECKPHNFRRLHDDLNLKAFKTSEGYLSLRAGVVLSTQSKSDPKISAEQMLQQVEQHLEQAYATNLITEVRIPQLV